MAEIRIPKVAQGTNEDGVPCFGPAEPLPERYISLSITETEYVVTVADAQEDDGA